jgi:glyoxylase-like metal-dependent hydrolase (beta-lactamase superfamily II)
LPKPAALAATVVLHRRAPELEVYWVQRADALQFLGGFHAFPGGRVDRNDRATAVEGADGDAAAMIAGAAREVFEETGVLLARGAKRVPAARRDEARTALLAESLTFADFLAAESLALDARDFVPAGRWQSPPFQPGGFDTQFFLAELPDGEAPAVWEGELQRGEWIGPAEALARWRENHALLAAPALGTLRELEAHPSDAPAAWAERLGRPPEARGGRVPRIEVHPGFVLFPVRTPTLAPATHTNCLVIGGPEVLIVDPGSPYEEEQQALDASLDALLSSGRRVRGILVTHHHADHWGGVAHLKERLGVPVYAHAWTAPKVGADTPLDGGETIELTPDGARAWKIEVLFTPGHTPGHLALYERVSGTIVAGDLVSGLSTVVVDPPEGDMRLYVESIRRLRELPATLILPGHGPPIGGPAHRLDFYLGHRAWREEKVFAALAQGPRSIEDLVPEVYDDTPPERHAPAARSALAHLLKLRDEGRVAVDPNGRWRRAEP